MKERIRERIISLYKQMIRFSAKDKKRTAAILSIAAVLILFFSGFLFGRIIFSKQYTLNSLESALIDKNYSKISKYCRVESEGKIKKNDIKPLADYFSSKDRVNSLMTALKNKSSYSDFIELKEKKHLIFTDYYISIKKVDIKVRVNFADTKLYLNGNEQCTTHQDKETVTIKNIIPGIYKLSAVNKNEFSELQADKEIVVMDNNLSCDLELNGVKVSIQTGYPDSEVYVNGKNTNLTAAEFRNKGPFNIEKNNEIYIEKTFPWGNIQSEKIIINGDPVINIPLKLNNEKLDSILNNTIEECVKSIFDAMNSEDVNMIKSDNKAKIYNEFVVERRLIKNQYELSQYDFKIDDSEILNDKGTFYGNIYSTLTYKVSKKIFGIELNSEEKKKQVFFKVQMNEDESWKVVDIYIIK